MMVGDAQRVADCGQSCIAGIQYVPYNTCSSSYVQQAGLGMTTFSPTTEW